MKESNHVQLEVIYQRVNNMFHTFKDKEEYLIALMRQEHPQHKEAMELKKLRTKGKSIIPKKVNYYYNNEISLRDEAEGYRP